MSHTLQLSGLPQARLLSPSVLSAVCRNSCALNWWCYPTISSSVAPFSSCLQSFLASGCFPLSWLFASGGQSIGVSASASVLPVNIQGWVPLALSGWISLSPRDSQESSPTPQFKSINSSELSLQREKGNGNLLALLVGMENSIEIP